MGNGELAEALMIAVYYLQRSSQWQRRAICKSDALGRHCFHTSALGTAEEQTFLAGYPVRQPFLVPPNASFIASNKALRFPAGAKRWMLIFEVLVIAAAWPMPRLLRIQTEKCRASGEQQAFIKNCRMGLSVHGPESHWPSGGGKAGCNTVAAMKVCELL
eukprot:3419597-Amphidinium_carterae.1